MICAFPSPAAQLDKETSAPGFGTSSAAIKQGLGNTRRSDVKEEHRPVTWAVEGETDPARPAFLLWTQAVVQDQALPGPAALSPAAERPSSAAVASVRRCPGRSVI